mmetsp:Transcript_59068/g.163378  ORF Transcript_59068/g.163378 Transcript_59068/m.163378 type:complete len:278 (+) Transcript_59068:88-921(+)
MHAGCLTVACCHAREAPSLRPSRPAAARVRRTRSPWPRLVGLALGLGGLRGGDVPDREGPPEGRQRRRQGFHAVGGGLSVLAVLRPAKLRKVPDRARPLELRGEQSAGLSGPDALTAGAGLVGVGRGLRAVGREEPSVRCRLGRREPRGRLGRQQPAHEAMGRGRLVPAPAAEEAGACQHGVAVHGVQHGHVAGFKGQLARDQEEEHAAGAPQVAGAIVNAGEHLRRGEQHRADDRVHPRLRGAGLRRLEVQQLQGGRRRLAEAEVRRLHVAVHDPQ